MQSNEAEQLLAAFAPFFPGAGFVGSYVGGKLVEGDGAAVVLQNPATGADSLSYRDAGAAVVQLAAAALSSPSARKSATTPKRWRSWSRSAPASRSAIAAVKSARSPRCSSTTRVGPTSFTAT